MTRIKYGGGYFSVAKCSNGDIAVEAKPGMSRSFSAFTDEEAARRWLGDHGLRRSKAKQLLAAELRNEGPFADPKHPRRVPA